MAALTTSDVFVPDVTVDEMFQHITAMLATRKGLRLERPAPDTLVIHHRYTPGWAVVLGIVGLIFFLLGLLFFLVKSTQTATVLGRNVEGGARFTATGDTSPEGFVIVHRALGQPGYGPPNPPPQPEPRPSTLVDGIEELAALRARGVLTDDEYQAAKNRLLHP